MSKNALGRGFDGLIPTGFDVSSVAEPGESVKQMPLDQLVANPDQPRKEFDKTALEELADSIKQHGIIQPLVATPFKDKFRIVAGERRFKAAQIAKLKKVPVIIRNHEELEELQIALVENVQRVDLSPLEQAVSVVRLRDQFSLSLKDISKKLGKAETTISNIIRLLQLPKEAVEALQKNKISEGHARAILSFKNDPSLQKELLNNIIKNKWSVRDAEEYVKKKKNLNKKSTQINSLTSKRLEKINSKQSYSAKIIPKKTGGNLTIKYKNNNELEKILSQLEK